VTSRASGVKVRLPSEWPVKKWAKVLAPSLPSQTPVPAAAMAASNGAATPTTATKRKNQPRERIVSLGSATRLNNQAALTASSMLAQPNGSAAAQPRPR
jgi:hypothetical protein